MAEFFMKARPSTEGDERFIYFEPSNENWDMQGERILQAGLAKSAAHYEKFGNVDIGHFTLQGMGDVAKAYGYEDPRLSEIGYPVMVKTSPSIVVKAAIYRGEGALAKAANEVWASMTEISPAKRWYPSVGGQTGDKECGPEGCTIKAPRWTNTGIWHEPVNTTVKSVSTMPFEVFVKALTSGYGTDAAKFEQGRALQMDAYTKAVKNMLKTKCSHFRDGMGKADLESHFEECESMEKSQATMAASRFLADYKEVNNVD